MLSGYAIRSKLVWVFIPEKDMERCAQCECAVRPGREGGKARGRKGGWAEAPMGEDSERERTTDEGPCVVFVPAWYVGRGIPGGGPL